MTRSKDIKDNQIISIVGATATGKTALALAVAEALLDQETFTKVHLLSADSRQVYRGLASLTGADVPSDFIPQKNQQFSYQFFNHPTKEILLHGVCIINPEDDWSAAHFAKLYQEVKDQLGKKELLIVVGGTGFYQKQIAKEAATLKLAPNPQLRKELEQLSVEELQKQLAQANPAKLAQMNHSDRHNPRRLIRAIELADTAEITTPSKQKSSHSTFYLQVDRAKREQKIKARVEERFNEARAEVALLLPQKISKLAGSSTGFKELSQFIQGEIDQDTCLKLWEQAEIQYAKRQDTWWKKQTDLIEIKGSSNLDFMLNYLQDVN